MDTNLPQIKMKETATPKEKRKLLSNQRSNARLPKLKDQTQSHTELQKVQNELL